MQQMVLNSVSRMLSKNKSLCKCNFQNLAPRRNLYLVYGRIVVAPWKHKASWDKCVVTLQCVISRQWSHL